MMASTMTNATSEAVRATMRTEHQVRLVNGREEGTAVAELPPGVYGFTGSPGLAAPLFAERRYRNFEIHHLRDGSVAIVGFVTAVESERLAKADRPIQVDLHSDAEGNASQIVAISYARISHHRQYSILNQPAMRITVGPQLEPA
jgi:hypothetical protein